jgi:muramidase (phage lysozyme)
MYLTLKNLTKKYNIDINNQLFSPEFQEKIARIKLKER